MILLVFTLSLMLSDAAKKIRSNYTECEKGACQPRTDRDINFIFDQPQPFYYTDHIRTQLDTADRLNIEYRSAVTARPEDAESEVPLIIHMIWLGSPWPQHRFSRNIQNYVTLNPGRLLFIYFKGKRSYHKKDLHCL